MIIVGNQQLLKSVNRMAIVRKIRLMPGISRAALADEILLTKSTVGKLVEELIAEGWLCESVVPITGNLGRRPTPLTLDNTRRLLFGARISAVQSELVAMSLGGDIKEISLTNASGSPEDVLDILAGQIDVLYRKLSGMGHEISGIGVAVPGPVWPDIGVLRLSESMNWVEVPVRDMLLERLRALGLPELELVVERAVGCVALQHFEYERVADEEPLLYIHIGHGIAAAAVMGNQVVRGLNGMAGFCSHLPVESDGYLCGTCGQRGCAKTVLTLDAMEQAMGTDVANIRTLAAAGDARTLAVIFSTGEKLGAFIYNQCLQYDPARVFLGGPAFQISGEFLRGAQTQLEKLAQASGLRPPSLQVMQFDRQYAALGAATTVLHKQLRATVTTN